VLRNDFSAACSLIGANYKKQKKSFLFVECFKTFCPNFLLKK